MLNYVSRGVDVLKNDGISPRILSALDGCEQLASPSERFAVHPQTAARLYEPKFVVAAVKKGHFFDCVANRTTRILVTVLTALSQHFIMSAKFFKSHFVTNNHFSKRSFLNAHVRLSNLNICQLLTY